MKTAKITFATIAWRKKKTMTRCSPYRKVINFSLGFLVVATLLLLVGCKPSSVHPQAWLPTADDIGGPGGDAPITEDGCISLLNGLDPVWMFENGWDLPCPDIDDDGIENECDIDITLGEDCNLNGVDDLCEPDFDFDDIIDACDDDIDGDGIPNDCDVDLTLGEDCDEDGQDDVCQIDTDNDGTIDSCELPIDCDDDDHSGCSDSCEDDCDGEKVTMCHRPLVRDGRTISISCHAVEAHLSHGDTIGPCQD